MKRAADGATLIAPQATLANAAGLPGLPQVVVEALRAGGADSVIGAALESGDEQRLAAALLAVDARVRRTDESGTKEIPIEDRLTLDGRILPRPGETLDGVVLRSSVDASAYREAAAEKIGVAARVALGGGPAPRILQARIVWWGLGPSPLIGHQLAAVLQGRRPGGALIGLAAQTARTEAQPAGAGMELEARRLDVVATLCREVLAAVLPDDAAAPG